MIEKSSRQERMTVAERTELARWVRMKCKAARNDATASIAERMAQFEEQMASVYDAQDKRWAELAEEAESKIKELDDELARRCAKSGIPERFRPRLVEAWCVRGENAIPKRRAELRIVAKARVEAQVKRAHAEIDRSEVELVGKIVHEGLDTDSAKAFFEAMPSVEQLVPRLSLNDVEAEADKKQQNRYLGA